MVDGQSAVGVAEVSELVLGVLRPRAHQCVLVEWLPKILIAGNSVRDDGQCVQRGLRLVDPEKRRTEMVPAQQNRDKHDQAENHRFAE